MFVCTQTQRIELETLSGSRQIFFPQNISVVESEIIIIGTVSTKIAPRLKCYKNASRLNRYNSPTDNAIDFLFSALHSEMV